MRLLLILALALLWRALLWAQPLHQLHNDEVEYVHVARDLLAGRGWSFYEQWRWLRAPLYPLFLAGSLWLSGGDLHLAAWPNLLLSVALVALIYHLTRALTPSGHSGPALLAALGAALLQTYATFASLYMSETLFSVLFTAALLALARWQQHAKLRYTLLAGLLFGLACLTRSAGLVMLPLAALWLTWLTWRRNAPNGAKIFWRPERASLRHLGLALLPGLSLGLAALLVIAPWTLRNCRAYGSCVLIETGGAYNLWAFYEPRESLDAINAALEAVANPVERADLATQRGLDRLREDPSIMLRKPWPEWERLWSVKPIQDRFLLASWYSDPPPAIFISALILDDLLYALILVASIVGASQALARRDPLALLLVLWIALFTAATMVTHAEGRYRHFFFMAMIPFAALALRRVAHHPNPPVPLALHLISGSVLGLALIPLLVYYPWSWAANGANRSVNRALGDWYAANGRVAAAEARYFAALGAEATPDGWIALGDLRRSHNDLGGAERFYQLAHETIRTYVGASAVWGDLLREQGRLDEARVVFRGVYIDQAHLSAWSFLMLDPAPQTRVDLGDGLDLGYVGGFYLPETQQGTMARWSTGRAQVRLAPSATTRILSMRVAGPRPDQSAAVVQVCAQQDCTDLQLTPTWRTVRLLVPGESEVISLRSQTFSAPDRRDLGILVDWVAVRALK